MVFILLNLLRYVLWLRIWSILVNVSVLRFDLEMSYPGQVQGRFSVNQKANLSGILFIHEYLIYDPGLPTILCLLLSVLIKKLVDEFVSQSKERFVIY